MADVVFQLNMFSKEENKNFNIIKIFFLLLVSKVILAEVSEGVVSAYEWIQINNTLMLQVLPYNVDGSKIKGEILNCSVIL